MGWKETLQWKVGIDVTVFAEKKTWSAFGVSVLLFAVIAYGGGSCHYAQAHMESEISGWQNLTGPYPVMIVSIGSWYDIETMEWLNESEPEENYFVPQWILGMGAHDSIIVNETTGERGDLIEHYFAHQIPLLLVIDHEGYIVGKQNSGTPIEGWDEFDAAVVSANAGESDDLRIGLKEVDRSFTGILALGLLLSMCLPCSSWLHWVLHQFRFERRRVERIWKTQGFNAKSCYRRRSCRSRYVDIFCYSRAISTRIG